MGLVVGGIDANTVLFLPMEGDDGSAIFANEAVGSATASIAALDGAQHSNAQAKFGSTSLYCNGGGARLEVSQSNAFRFGTGDWMVDFWGLVVDGVGNLFAWYLNDDNFMGLELVSTSGNSMTMRFRYRRGGVDVFVIPFSSTVLVDLAFRHFAVERSGTTIRVYFVGTVAGSATISATEAFWLNGWKLYIGNATRPGMLGLQRGHLYIDAFRVSNVARWSGASGAQLPDNIYTPRQTLSGSSRYALRSGVSMVGRGSHTVGARNYPLHGRGASGVIESVSVDARGTSVVIESGHTLQGRGAYALVERSYGLHARGLYRTLEAGRSLVARGSSGVHSGNHSLDGRGAATVRVANTLNGRGAFRLPTAYTWKSRGSFAVVDDTLDKVLVYHKQGTPPDPNVDTPTEYAAFPVLNFTLPQTAGLHYLLVRRRNKYGMESASIQMIVIELDATFNPINVRPSVPIRTAITLIAGGKVRLTASYLYGSDGSLQANNWNVYIRNDGTAPDPSTDTPVVVPIVKADGIARLRWDSAAQSPPATVKAIVRVARATLDTRDDGNSAVLTIVVLPIAGPATPVIDIDMVMPL